MDDSIKNSLKLFHSEANLKQTSKMKKIFLRNKSNMEIFPVQPKQSKCSYLEKKKRKKEMIERESQSRKIDDSCKKSVFELFPKSRKVDSSVGIKEYCRLKLLKVRKKSLKSKSEITAQEKPAESISHNTIIVNKVISLKKDEPTLAMEYLKDSRSDNSLYESCASEMMIDAMKQDQPNETVECKISGPEKTISKSCLNVKNIAEAKEKLQTTVESVKHSKSANSIFESCVGKKKINEEQKCQHNTIMKDLKFSKSDLKSDKVQNGLAKITMDFLKYSGPSKSISESFAGEALFNAVDEAKKSQHKTTVDSLKYSGPAKPIADSGVDKNQTNEMKKSQPKTTMELPKSAESTNLMLESIVIKSKIDEQKSTSKTTLAESCVSDKKKTEETQQNQSKENLISLLSSEPTKSPTVAKEDKPCRTSSQKSLVAQHAQKLEPILCMQLEELCKAISERIKKRYGITPDFMELYDCVAKPKRRATGKIFKKNDSDKEGLIQWKEISKTINQNLAKSFGMMIAEYERTGHEKNMVPCKTKLKLLKNKCKSHTILSKGSLEEPVQVCSVDSRPICKSNSKKNLKVSSKKILVIKTKNSDLNKHVMNKSKSVSELQNKDIWDTVNENILQDKKPDSSVKESTEFVTKLTKEDNTRKNMKYGKLLIVRNKTSAEAVSKKVQNLLENVQKDQAKNKMDPFGVTNGASKKLKASECKSNDGKQKESVPKDKCLILNQEVNSKEAYPIQDKSKQKDISVKSPCRKSASISNVKEIKYKISDNQESITHRVNRFPNLKKTDEIKQKVNTNDKPIKLAISSNELRKVSSCNKLKNKELEEKLPPKPLSSADIKVNFIAKEEKKIVNVKANKENKPKDDNVYKKESILEAICHEPNTKMIAQDICKKESPCQQKPGIYLNKKRGDPCTKKKDPCKMKEDPSKKKEDHCKKKEDPCKKKEDLHKKKEDPCKKEEDPCKKKEDPCQKKEDPSKKKEDPCKKEEDPCKKKEDPCKKKEDPCKKKEDPCKKKENPTEKKEDPCNKKEDQCKKKEDLCKKKEDPCKKKEDPCKKKEDLHKKKEDPCKKKEDPCKKKENPTKKKEDPCKKKEDPCKKKEDPCKKKEDPCKKKEDLYKKKEDPCKKQEDPCKQKEDPCKKKEDPCKKKEDPCKKKEDPCKKKEDLYKKKEDPCKKQEDPCKKKEDPCKKKEDPCKKKDEPCKKEDPCKKKEDPCKQKEDPCKKKEDPCQNKEDPCKKREDPCKKKDISMKRDPCKKSAELSRLKEYSCNQKSIEKINLQKISKVAEKSKSEYISDKFGSQPYRKEETQSEIITKRASMPIFTKELQNCGWLVEPSSKQQEKKIANDEPIQKGLKKLTSMLPGSEVSEMKDMGLMSQCMKKIGKNGPLISSITDAEAEKAMCKGEKVVCKVKKFSCGEKMICSLGESRECPKELNFDEEGVERILKCAIVKDKDDNEKFICTEIIPKVLEKEKEKEENEVLKSEQETCKPGRDSGRRIKVISNKLVCRKGPTLRHGARKDAENIQTVYCRLVTVEEIKTPGYPRRKNNRYNKMNKIKNRMMAQTFKDLMRKCREKDVTRKEKKCRSNEQEEEEYAEKDKDPCKKDTGISN